MAELSGRVHKHNVYEQESLYTNSMMENNSFMIVNRH